MALLKHQRQKYGDNCGPTCLAMLARKTQAAAIFAMFKQRRKKYCYSWYPDLRRGLDEFEMIYGKSEHYVSKWKDIPTIAIVSVDNEDHWVVFSPTEGLVYDPLRKKPVAVGNYHRVPDSYLAVRPIK